MVLLIKIWNFQAVDNCLLITLPNCFIVRVSKKKTRTAFLLENSGDFNGFLEKEDTTWRIHHEDLGE